jgi:cardiolipin synthase
MNHSAPTVDSPATFQLLRSGDEYFGALLAAIEAARRSVRLETYIFAPSSVGERVREALVAAAQRGAVVRVLVDALGSRALSEDFWAPLHQAGGQFKWFNPLALGRLAYRDHRKLLVCDEAVGLIGGFNIAPEYEGDGVSRGWRDVGLRLTGPPAAELAQEFDVQFARADFKHKRLQRLRPARHALTGADNWKLLLSGPGRRHGEIKRTLTQDLRAAQSVQIVAAYFLPTWRLRRQLLAVARRGGRVQLILAGRTDVWLSQLASRSLYQRLLRRGIEIFEYQPQVLHAKLFLVDDAVYVGSANLDTRSLQINYELVLRVTDPTLAGQARALFEDIRSHSQPINRQMWRQSRTWWNKLRERWAYFILARLDPLLARWQLKNLR